MAILAVDCDIAGRRVEIKAAIVLPPALALANDHFRIRALDAARHTGAVVADLAANPFGIGGVRECKPQGCRCDADQEFGHRQPPLRPHAVSLGCAPRYQLQSDGLVPYLVMKARAYAAGPSFGCYRPPRAD